MTKPISPLRQRMIDDMTMRNLSPSTRETYIRAVAQFSTFHRRSPDKLGVEHLREYHLHLVSRGLSANSICVKMMERGRAGAAHTMTASASTATSSLHHQNHYGPIWFAVVTAPVMAEKAERLPASWSGTCAIGLYKRVPDILSCHFILHKLDMN